MMRIICFFGRHAWAWRSVMPPQFSALVDPEVVLNAMRHPEIPDKRWPMHEYCSRCGTPK